MEKVEVPCVTAETRVLERAKKSDEQGRSDPRERS